MSLFSSEDQVRGGAFGLDLRLLPLPAPLALSANEPSFNPKPGSRSENLLTRRPAAPSVHSELFLCFIRSPPASSEHFLPLITGHRSHKSTAARKLQVAHAGSNRRSLRGSASNAQRLHPAKGPLADYSLPTPVANCQGKVNTALGAWLNGT